MKKIITFFLILTTFILSSDFALAAIQTNDTFIGRQWYLSKIKANNAWGKITSSPNTVIAVIDSGVQLSHPDLANNIWTNRGEIDKNGIDDDHNGYIDDVYGWNFVNNVADPSPRFSKGWTEIGVSHGTIVAGIIAAEGNNHRGIAGITWKAKIMPLKVLDSNGKGRLSDVVKAIDYAVNNGADIINLSLVSFKYNETMQEAIARANKAGVIIVAAAGNEKASGQGYDVDKTPIYPACYDGRLIGENMVIGVAATDALDQKTPFSSYGFRCVDITAPGISFFSTIAIGSIKGNPNQAYDGYWSGTSMSAPLVSGALALIEAANPSLSRQEVVNVLFASTDNISRLNANYLGQLGNGRLNIDQAVSMAKSKLYEQVGRLLVIPGGDKAIRLTAANGDLVSELSLPAEIRKGNIITGDINDDGQDYLIIGAAKGDKPNVSIINQQGVLLHKFLAYDDNFRGGIKVALIDLDNDNQPEIVVAPASGLGSEIRIYDTSGRLKRSFWAAGRNYKGGFSLSVGDIDGKGNQQIILGFGKGNEPQIRIFNKQGKLIGVFLAYEKSFRGGINVSVANIDGRKDHSKGEIIVSPGPGRYPLVKVFDNHSFLKHQFYAYTKNWQGGVYLATGDLDNDGISDIALGAYPGATPQIRVFSGQGILKESFYALPLDFSGGVNIEIMKIKN